MVLDLDGGELLAAHVGAAARHHHGGIPAQQRQRAAEGVQALPLLFELFVGGEGHWSGFSRDRRRGTAASGATRQGCILAEPAGPAGVGGLSQAVAVLGGEPAPARLLGRARSRSIRPERYSGDRVLRAIFTYSAGTTNSVSATANTAPKNTVAPMDWRLSAPAPVAIISGTAPAAVASVVISTGRRRAVAASIVASTNSLPAIAQLVRELHDQDAVLAGDADQHDRADLAEDVDRRNRTATGRRARR